MGFLYYFAENPWIVVLLSLGLIILFALFLTLLEGYVQTQHRKTNPLIASDIPDWSEIPMEYIYIE